jgi:hypothetical protein
VSAVGPEGDERAGVGDALELVDVARDHVGQVLVVSDADHGHEVGMPGHGVDLGHPGDVGQLDGEVGHAGRYGVDQHEGVDHGVNLVPAIRSKDGRHRRARRGRRLVRGRP